MKQQSRTEYERLEDDIRDCPDCSLYSAHERGEPLSDDLLCADHNQKLEELKPLTPRDLGEIGIRDVGKQVQQQRDNKAVAFVTTLVSVCLGGLGGVYLSRYFAGWPAQVAGGTFIWGLLSLAVFLAISSALQDAGVIENE